MQQNACGVARAATTHAADLRLGQLKQMRRPSYMERQTSPRCGAVPWKLHLGRTGFPAAEVREKVQQESIEAAFLLQAVDADLCMDRDISWCCRGTHKFLPKVRSTQRYRKEA